MRVDFPTTTLLQFCYEMLSVQKCDDSNKSSASIGVVSVIVPGGFKLGVCG